MIAECYGYDNHKKVLMRTIKLKDGMKFQFEYGTMENWCKEIRFVED